MNHLSEAQKEFIAAEGNVVLHACPGSGKTYVVAHKLLHYMKKWKKTHQGVAILSFTNVASEEIKKRIEVLTSDKLQIGYPHYIGTLDSFINHYIVLRFGYLFVPSQVRLKIIRTDLVALPFSWLGACYQNRCVKKIEGKSIFSGRKSNKCEGKFCRKYKNDLLKKGFIFQEDTVTLAIELLKKYPDIAKALVSRFPIFILDEAQDTSESQMEILNLLNEAGTKSMFLVGDPDQAIYEWRNATPECFRNKMVDSQWNVITLTENFRSSQLICNATHAFSKSLENKLPSIAQGMYSEHEQKPILLLYHGVFDACKKSLVEYFMNLCLKNEIKRCSENIAIVTRGKIYSDTDVPNLWKSNEVELFAQSSYEWFSGERKRAYELCEKALFCLVIKNYGQIKGSLSCEIEEKMSYYMWRIHVIDILTHLPNVNQPIGIWINNMIEMLNKKFHDIGWVLHDSRNLKQVIEIKSRDKYHFNFKNIPLRNFFEKTNKEDYTLSSIHGVKGETYDALMLMVSGVRGNTITPAGLTKGALDSELMRIAYVAMTRPRKLLVVAMPHKQERYDRFPEEKWNYDYL